MAGDATEPRDEELVASLGWVQGLALALAGSRDSAEDLSQDLARAWLVRRPSFADGPRGWFAAVARRLVLDRARSEAARGARERSVARPEAVEEAVTDVVERAARQRRVAEAVMQLAEPYRSTILLRYLDELPTREVARRTGVNEAAVRKRIERGLALLRERLDGEFGSRSRAWALALLEPALRASSWKGVGLMGAKGIAAAGIGAAALVAGAIWWWGSGASGEEVTAVGGRAVIVPAEVAERRELQAEPVVLEPTRTGLPVAPAVATDSPTVAGLRGHVLVDEEHRAPSGLSIRAEPLGREQPVVDVAGARWSLDGPIDAPLVLWITSPSTVPARIPVPRELREEGGVLDLHLSNGRTLVLTFVDRETGTPLPHLDFELSSAIDLERGGGRVLRRSHESIHRTDERGQAILTGAALAGSVSVRVDFEPREREILMRDGRTFTARWGAESVWSTWLDESMPMRIEATIRASPPLGEAFAAGTVPAWAGEGIRVVACERTDDPRRPGDPFVLPQDAGGRFELRANAPSRFLVWLEQAGDRRRGSEETEVDLDRPGAHDAVVLRPLAEGAKVALRFVNVPDRGTVVVRSTGRPESIACRGEEIRREVEAAESEAIEVTLRLGGDEHAEDGWRQRLVVDARPEIVVDLAGADVHFRIEGAAGMLALLRCEGSEARAEQAVVVACAGGSATTPVRIPSGRWLYRYEAQDRRTAWGVVDVPHAGGEVVLRPRSRPATPEELESGVRIDEVEGVSLAKLPEKLRIVPPPPAGGELALPLDAKVTALPAATPR